MHLVVTLNKYYQLMLTTLSPTWDCCILEIVWGTYVDLQLNDSMLLTVASGHSAESGGAIMTCINNEGLRLLI